MPANAQLIRKGEGSVFGNDFLKSAFPALNFFFPNQLLELYRKVVQTEDQPILETLLETLKINLQIDAADLERIPANGAVIAAANHPFGILDGVALGALALRIRPDVKILTNYLLATIPELEPHCIFVDPFHRSHSKKNNSAGLKQAINHLRTGGMLIVFPAGEVSHWQFKHGEISDPQWSDTTSRLVRATGSSVLPVLFTGSNSLPFHLLGLIHPMLRTARLPHELLNKTGKTVEVRIGTPIPARRICEIPNDREATDFLRWRTYLLAHRGAKSRLPIPFKFPAPFQRSEAIAPPVPQHSLLAELHALGEEKVLCANRDFSVYAARGHEIPNLLSEIGRQREITFREAGEGTGKALDLDEFDSHYTHLILWSKANQELAGAYRLVNAQEVLGSKGIRGLYTSTLFHYDPRLFAEMGPALELGRSFVCGAYQKQYASLLMLWKGIAAYVGRHPQTPILFGAVSMSSSYSRASLELVTQFFGSQDSNPLASFVRPKRSLRPARKLPDWELSAIRNLLGLDELSSSVAEIEKDGKGVPVLLKQYVKVGGTVLAFNVDKNFSDVLDGLIVVDLRKTDPARLEPYMSKQALAAFRQYHGLTPASKLI